MARLRPPSANWRRDELHADIETSSSRIECRRSGEMVENNPFAFSPAQLSKIFGPKGMSAFHALGGLRGIEAGLQTHRNSALSIDENNFGRSSFEEASNLPFSKSRADDPNQPNEPSSYGNAAYFHYATLADQKRIFMDNRLPKMSKSLLELFLAAKSDIVLHDILELIILVNNFCAVIRASTCGLEIKDDSIARKSLQAVTLMEHLSMALVLLAVPWTSWKMWLEYSRIALLNQSQDRPAKVIRSSITTEISLFDLMPGDSVVDSIILSGSTVLEGLGTLLVVATGVHSVDGKIKMILMNEPKIAQHEWIISLVLKILWLAFFHPRLIELLFQGILSIFGGTFWEKLKAASNACIPHTAMRNDKQSFLPILLEGESALALPDTEVGYNVITEDYAALIGVRINRDLPVGKSR
ncbi:hypothetical protein PFICI_02181 [Pestalotiopsis fici W106-1]|uniref:Uncharacterized protein n=1 Tax=Pestalotiopsis fici (strain W106-1 / CGMCC3.15140) TaxID=1229662 RepID=W3XG26_PESFW|nr:uncharacterized protein PFICI_02181 [Pestalotiopsis fici W106-1]ETS84156.1 hypothetical protein PFICI_02181 [Pestalotiopsis fici W106-1]